MKRTATHTYRHQLTVVAHLPGEEPETFVHSIAQTGSVVDVVNTTEAIVRWYEKHGYTVVSTEESHN